MEVVQKRAIDDLHRVNQVVQHRIIDSTDEHTDIADEVTLTIVR